jgi:hypothetical protein
LIIGDPARFALCKFAKPFAKPGPKCNNVQAGFSAIRPYPSAAPVTTPSNNANIGRILLALLIAATKCISDVPGLAKQTSTPLFSNVAINASAPVI